jgi:hypothetical protein
MSIMTDVETELRKMSEAAKPVAPQASLVLELAADIVASSTRNQLRLKKCRDALKGMVEEVGSINRNIKMHDALWSAYRYAEQVIEKTDPANP